MVRSPRTSAQKRGGDRSACHEQAIMGSTREHHQLGDMAGMSCQIGRHQIIYTYIAASGTTGERRGERGEKKRASLESGSTTAPAAESEDTQLETKS